MDYANAEAFYSDESDNLELSPEWREAARDLVEENPAERWDVDIFKCQISLDPVIEYSAAF